MKMRPLLVVLSLLLPGISPLQSVWADGGPISQDEVARAKRTMQEDQRRLKQDAEREKKEGTIARQRLGKEFNIDANGMSDSEAIIRLRDELNEREAASEAAAQQQREQAEAQREKQQRQLLQKQEALIKGTFGTGSEEVADDEDAAEEKMYEQMVRGGAAPQCRGKTGQALIACVDAAMDAE